MKTAPEMIVILGPTATGKTRVAVALARAARGEIVSADSRQVYRRMDIGTGKDLSDYGTGADAVPYHLIDIAEPGTEFSVFHFQRAFLAAYNAISERGRLPILCGGTGLYIASVLERYELVEAPRNETLRAALADLDHAALCRRLAELRPLHNVTDTTDRARLVRAIEIAEHSRDVGAPAARFPAIRAAVYGLRIARADLKKRITARLNARLADGLIEEVERLLADGLTPEQLEFYGLEYRFVTQHVTGRLNRNDMTQKLREAIYQFARRQEKWFRRMARRGTQITWLPAEQDPARLAVHILDDIV